MYKIGVIGGMGPLATVDFYKRLVLNSKAKSDNEHENIIILNHATIPDRSESILNKEYDKFLNAIKKDIEILDNLNVSLIAIPCNTSHFFYDEMSNFTQIPIVNMVEETIIEAKKKGYKKIAVFSTLGTRNAKVYDKYAKKHGVELVDISDVDANKVMQIIYEIKNTNILNNYDFLDIAKKYCSDEVLGVIACTELSLLDMKKSFNYIDACEILAIKSLEMSINEA